jgi:hypothetical protein
MQKAIGTLVVYAFALFGLWIYVRRFHFRND